MARPCKLTPEIQQRIGENSAPVRAALCRKLEWLGVKLDEKANASNGPRISTPDSSVSVWVIPTNEELMIAQHTLALLDGATESNLILNKEGLTMFKILEGMPPEVMAIEAIGKVTHEDYRNTLIPKAEAMIAKGPIRMLYVIGKEFTGFELQALWDDSEFGIKHWHDFSHIAVVTDDIWISTMINMFKPFFHGEVRLFKLSELPAAKDWISDAKAGAKISNALSLAKTDRYPL
jgi:hypothetical protein